MKILFINTTDNHGGAARIVWDLKSGLERLGHHASWFVKKKFSDENNIFEVKRENKIIQKISKLIGKDVSSILHNKVYKYLSNDIEFFNNKNLINSKELQEADIVHCHNLHHNYFNLKLLAEISKSKPVVWSLHDMWAFTPHEAWVIGDKFKMEVRPHLTWNNRKYLLNKKQGIYNKSKLHIVSTSDWFLKEAESSILKNQKHYLIYNGVDETIFKPGNKVEAKKKLNLPLNKKIISFMAAGGRHNEQKGWEYAKKVIEYYKDNKNILFLCIGSSSQDKAINNHNIKYIEYVESQEKFAKYYRASDIFLNPSMAEAFCLVLVQAMASQIPVVTFATGIASRAIIHKKNGYIAKYQNAKDLIDGIEYILSLDKDALENMGKLSREIVINNFTTSKMLKNYIKLYKKII